MYNTETRTGVSPSASNAAESLVSARGHTTRQCVKPKKTSTKLPRKLSASTSRPLWSVKWNVPRIVGGSEEGGTCMRSLFKRHDVGSGTRIEMPEQETVFAWLQIDVAARFTWQVRFSAGDLR